MSVELATSRLRLTYEPDVETFDWVGGGRCGVYYLWHGTTCAGAISITSLSKGNGEIGYELDPSCWGRGFATEAVSAVIHSAEANFGFTLLSAQVHADNTASRRVLEKTGFGLVGSKLSWSAKRDEPMAVMHFRRFAESRPR